MGPRDKGSVLGGNQRGEGPARVGGLPESENLAGCGLSEASGPALFFLF